MISINHILLLRYPDSSLELGEALWAATKEVENFYNFGEQRAIFRRSYLSDVIPESVEKKDAGGAFPKLQKIWGYFTGAADRPVEKEKSEVTMTFSQADSKWNMAEGQYVRSYDAGKIARLAGELAGLEPSATQVVVTDLVLVPPPGLRYIIWDSNVISIAPTDPKFWNIRESNRNAVIKHRVRTACLSVVGQLLGLRRCDNERCFLFGDVDSVTCLDDMVVLGPEHNIKALSQRGFEIFAKEPGKVQPIKDNPKAEADLE